MGEKIANQPSVWIPSGMPGLQAQLDGWLARIRARERQGDEAPGRSTTWPRSWPRCASSRTPASWPDRRPRRSAPAPMPGRCASPSASAMIRRSAFPSTDRGRALHEFRRHGASPGLRLDRRRRRQRLRAPLRANAHRSGRRALPDRRRLRARRLRQRRHPHLPGRRPLHRGAARGLRHRAAAQRAAIAPPVPARASATPMPRRCGCWRRACSTPACSTATRAATSTR